MEYDQPPNITCPIHNIPLKTIVYSPEDIVDVCPRCECNHYKLGACTKPTYVFCRYAVRTKEHFICGVE